VTLDLDAIRERADEVLAKIPDEECCSPNECYAPTLMILRADVLLLVGRIQELEDDQAESVVRWPEVADAWKQAARKAEAERDTLREALERLASTEGFEGAGDVRYGDFAARELKIRGEFARAALTQGAGDDDSPHPDWRNGAGIVDDT
jgi:hypothetical protein